MSFISFIKNGAVVNFIAVTVGSLLGVLLKKGMPERVRKTLVQGMALCVFLIGVTGLFEDGINILTVIISCALGAVIGEFLDLDGQVNKLGNYIQNKFSSSSDSKIAEGFVTATLLFCIGAMTVVGSIDSGISGDNTTLYSKSLIDGISAIALASSLGIGVALSAVSVLAIEGALTALAVIVEPVLSSQMISYMSVIGSLLIVAISFNMLGITKIKAMNLIPAVFVAIPFCLIGG